MKNEVTVTEVPAVTPVATNSNDEIVCPCCGRAKLQYGGAEILQHTMDEAGYTHPVLLNVDAYDGTVSLTGISRKDAVNDRSRIAMHYDCPDCRKLEDFRIVMHENNANYGSKMMWLDLRSFQDQK